MTPQLNDRIYALLGTFGFRGALNDRWKGYLKSFGLAGTNDDMLYSFLGQLGYEGSLTDRWNAYLASVGGSFVGFAKLYLNFADGTNRLDPKINFTRTTNATVTNSAGVITYAPHNLLTYSEQFDNAAWVKDNSTVTANSTTAPDGTVTADKLIENNVNTFHRTRQASSVISNNIYTASIYIKAGERNFAQIRYENAGSTQLYAVNINLLTREATTSSFGSPVSTNYNIENIGDGWLRVSLTVSANNTTFNFYTYSSNALGTINYQGDGTSGIYVWGAQLEIGSTATTYNPTTVKNLLGFSELFDNAAWTKSNSFVQTNLLTYSEAFDNAAWMKAETTVSANTILAPNGYQTADKIVETIASGVHAISENIALTINNTYTQTYYVKPAERTKVQLRRGVAGALPTPPTALVFDLTTGTYSGSLASGWTNPTITPVNDGWFKITITVTATATSIDAVGLYLCDSSGAFSYTGDGTSGLYIWGAQLVQGTDAGAYHRTDAVALPVFYANHNGVVCAEKLVESTAATSVHGITQAFTTTAAPHTISVYAKAGERNWVLVGNSTVASARAWFNLSTGVKGTLGVGASSSTIEAVGNGYYRCSVTLTTTSASNTFYIYSATADGAATYTGDGTSGIYIFGAQLSDSASLDPYVLNAAAAPSAQAYYGARFDYDPVTLAPKGLLIEEQRSNLLLNSNDFSTVNWNKVRATISSNSIVAPDGTLTASKLVTDTTPATTHYMQQAVTTTAISYTFSTYAKAGEYNEVYVLNGTISAGVYFNILNGTIVSTIGTATGSITNVGNGWYRCSVVITATAASNSFRISIAQNGSQTIDGDGTSGIYLWGTQLEAGAFATSYIPTAASAVTRAADVAVIQGSNFYSWYNQNEGSIFANASSGNTAASTFPACVNFRITNLSNNQMSLIYLNSNTNLSWDVSANTVAQASITIAGTAKPALNKMAGTYKVNDFQFAVNNTLGTADTSGITPIIDEVALGRLYNNTNYWNGHIKQISYYPQRLSNDVLKGLTA